MVPRKIVQVCAIDSTMDKLLRELNLYTMEQGYEVIGVCSKGELTEKLTNEGFNIVNVNIDRSIRPISNIRTIIKLYKLFKKLKPDIVHVHTPVAAVLGRIAAKLSGIQNIIYTAHGFYFHENMKPVVYKLVLGIEKFMARYFTDFIFTQSQEDSKTAVVNKFKAADRIMAIGNGVDVWGKFNPQNIDLKEVEMLRSELNIRNEDRVITFVGRLVREKGILDLLEAFEQFNRNNVKLLIVGGQYQGDRDIEGKAIIENYKKHKNIIFTGIRTDIPNILYASDIFCLPSYREGMPRSIIEAMAMNCAVVATNIRGAREEIIDGETGYLVKIKSPEDIKKKFERLLMNSELLDLMKREGRQRAERLYDEKKVVKLQVDVFNKLINKELQEEGHGGI